MSVRNGFLYPLGHRASLIEITERKLPSGNQTQAEYLLRRTYLVVKEPVKGYSSRAMPFPRVRITTSVTPALDPPFGPPAFPKVGGRAFRFHMIADDWDGQRVDFSMPLLYVEQPIPQDIVHIYTTGLADADRRAELGNQVIAFAPSTPERRGLVRVLMFCPADQRHAATSAQ